MPRGNRKLGALGIPVSKDELGHPDRRLRSPRERDRLRCKPLVDFRILHGEFRKNAQLLAFAKPAEILGNRLLVSRRYRGFFGRTNLPRRLSPES